jgi:hypothetical protein
LPPIARLSVGGSGTFVSRGGAVGASGTSRVWDLGGGASGAVGDRVDGFSVSVVEDQTLDGERGSDGEVGTGSVVGGI